MENSLDRSNESLNPQQPLKVDDKQNLFASTFAIGTVESITQSNGSGLSHTVRDAIDKWAGKIATDYFITINSSTPKSNPANRSEISLFQPQSTNPNVHYAPLAAKILAVTSIKQPANIVPQGLVINGVKSSYDTNSTLLIKSALITDGNGWQDVSKVDFWLTNSKGKRVELADVTSFSSKDKSTAMFNYTTSLKGIADGDYKLNAVAYDKSGAKSNQFTQSITIKPANVAPTTPVITGLKTSYDANSILSIDSGLTSDGNGWQDVSKVDFYLTNAQGTKIDLADAVTFTAQDVSTAKFSYSVNLTGIAAGDYKLNAVTYDKSGLVGSPFTQSFNIKPVNVAPTAPVITGLKSSYDANSVLSIDSGLTSDGNGWQDVSKVDFYLTNAQNQRIELTDANNFLSQDANTAKFSYATSLTGIAAGDYKLNAITYDKAGLVGAPFTQAFNIKPANVAPTTPVITGLKTSYDANSILSIDSGLTSDGNGWQDVSKVDFYLTDAQGTKIDLADAVTFTAQDASTAKFSYSVNLTGIAAGDYKLNAVTYDKAGLVGSPFTQSFNIKSVNVAPTAPVITGLKSSYDANSILSIDSGFALDGNGWQDVSKVDFYLTNAQGTRIELADATTFTAQDANSARFNYSTSLSGLAAGGYILNAVTYDKAGVASNTFAQAFNIKPVNIAPTAPVITGIKSSYDTNSILSIDSGLTSDSNGWQDISKVDFYLTNALGQRVELADVSTFTTQDVNAAKFSYTTSLNGIVAGDYKLNAVAYDKAGVASNPFTQAVNIKPANVAPGDMIVYGVKSSYDANSTLTIDTGYAYDSNGPKDINKVDFWLTNAQGQRIELADVDTFSYQDPNWSQFQYATSLNGIAAGDYKLNAVAYDKAGLAGNPFAQSFTIKPANIAPQTPVITGIKSSYEANSTLSIDSGLTSDGNGWQDVSKVDFYLTNVQGTKIDLADAVTFTAQDVNTAKFSYSVNLTGIAAGDYKLNAVTYDKAGLVGSPFTQAFNIKPVNVAPTAPVITGLKSSYDANSVLSIDSGLTSDGNGWQDVSKVDFYLTNAQGTKIDLADATTFTAQDASSAKFNYNVSLNGIAAGDYKLNAVAYDKLGSNSNQFTQLITIKPANIAPGDMIVYGVKSSYEPNSTLAIDIGYAWDSNGWQDITKVDFWLTNSQGQRIELVDANNFSFNSANWSQFQYTTSLSGIAAGEYKLNAVAYDKGGLAGNPFAQSFTIKPTNVAPQAPIITGIKSSYEANSTLSINSGLVSDSNGWQDISKVDFYLTNAQGTRIELADVTTFTTQDASSAKFNYTVSLNGIAADDYKLNAITYDKSGVASNPFTQAFNIKPANVAPQAPIINGLQSSYSANSTLSLDLSYAGDINGWQDINKVDFWLTNSQNQRIELADVTSFNQNNEVWSQFKYTTNLSGIAAGDYKLNAVAYDKAGVAGTLFAQSFIIKPANVAPQAPIINGLQSSYSANSTLSLDLSYAGDINGWQDVNKVDFWLTNSQNQRIELADVTSFDQNNEVWSQFKYTTNLSGIAIGDYKLNAVAYDKSGLSGNLFTQSFNIKYGKFKEDIEINTQWLGTVFRWDESQGKPPANLFDGGYNSSNAIAEINLGSNDLGNGRKGINFDIGQGALKGYNDRLPSDFFAVRAYTQANFDGGEYKFHVRGDDGFQLLAKNIVTNEWIYITPKDQWQTPYGNFQDLPYTLPQGRYDLHFHYFEGGGDANFNLAWEKVTKPDIDIQLYEVYDTFTDWQTNALVVAEKNWERIITNDKDSSGILKLAFTQSYDNVLDGVSFQGSSTLANTYLYQTINYRYNHGGDIVDIDGVDYHNRINFNSYFLPDQTFADLVGIMMHEIGHTLGLDHEDINGLMYKYHGDYQLLSSQSFDELERQGYKVNRNARIDWS